MPKNVPHTDKVSYSLVYRAWLVEGLVLARSLARRIGHSQPWNLGLRRARRDTFLVRGGLPGGSVVLLYSSVLFFTWGAGEGSVGRGHGALLSAQERSMRGLKQRSRGGLQERSGRGGGEAGERGRHLGQELPSLSEPESRI